jgi:hypothetical protein
MGMPSDIAPSSDPRKTSVVTGRPRPVRRRPGPHPRGARRASRCARP